MKPVVLTADNIGDFSMADVVLPLPGHQVVYPENQGLCLKLGHLQQEEYLKSFLLHYI